MGIFDFINKKREENKEDVMAKFGEGEIKLLDYLRLSKDRLSSYEFAALATVDYSAWILDRMGRNHQSVERLASMSFVDGDVEIYEDGKKDKLSNISYKIEDPISHMEEEVRFNNPMDFINYKTTADAVNPGGVVSEYSVISKYFDAIIVDASGYCLNGTCAIYCSSDAPVALFKIVKQLCDDVQTFNNELAADSKINYGDMVNKHFIKTEIVDSKTGVKYATPEEFFSYAMEQGNEQLSEGTIKR